MRQLAQLCLTLLLWSGYGTSLYAQITLETQIRPRTELRHGFQSLATLNQPIAFFTTQRSRIILGVKHKFLETKINVQDVRTWGSQPPLVTDDGNLTTLHEAWGILHASPLFSFKFGRQEIAYNNHRVFGRAGWAQQSRSHDALIIRYEDSTYTAHIGLSYNQDQPQNTTNVYTVPNSYKTFQYTWLNAKWDWMEASFLFVNNGIQTTKISGIDTLDATKFSQTFGTYLNTSTQDNRLDGYLEFYYQMGKSGNIEGTPIQAYTFNGELNYTFLKKETTSVSLKTGFQILSGNDETTNNNIQNAFTPLYASNHRHNGLMDYFYVGNHAGSVGLNDLYGGFSAQHKALGFQLIGHVFLAHQPIQNTNTLAAMPPYLGTEADLVVSLKLHKWVQLKAGYSQLFASSSMEMLKGGNANALQNWAWLMLDINPKFSFDIDKKK